MIILIKIKTLEYYYFKLIIDSKNMSKRQDFNRYYIVNINMNFINRSMFNKLKSLFKFSFNDKTEENIYLSKKYQLKMLSKKEKVTIHKNLKINGVI